MTRRIKERIIFKGALVARAPVHVGGGFDDPETDMPLAVNGKGEYYIPGTSIAGVLRQWFARTFGKKAMEEIFGYTATENDEGFASFILVEDAVLQDEGITPEVRDGVGINRYTGAAARGIKYDRQILPRGSRFSFELTLEVPDGLKDADTSDDWANSVAQTVRALMDGQMRLGAAKSRGLGRMKLEDVKVRREELLTSSGILSVLKRQSAGKYFNEEFNNITAQSEKDILRIMIKWKPVGPLMVKAEAEGLAVDMLPLFTRDDSGRMARVIPGSSIKGVLRATAERIMATLLDDHDMPQDDFLQQVERDALVTALFGARGKRKGQQAREEGDWKEGLSALFADDCHCTDDALEREQWQKLFTGDDAAFNNLPEHWQRAMHVAIDRFTGGAAERFLYSRLEPFDGAWEPIQLEIDLKRLPASQKNAALALLLLVLREMAQERVPLGYATHRGMGSIEVEEITFSGAEEPPVRKLAPADFGKKECMSEFGEWERAWQEYLQAARRNEQAA